MTRLYQVALLVLIWGFTIQGYPPIQRYNPNVYYGPRSLSASQETRYSYGKPSYGYKLTRQRDTAYTYEYPHFDADGPIDLNDPVVGPEIEQMLTEYIRSTHFEDTQGPDGEEYLERGSRQEGKAEFERMLRSYEMLRRFEDLMANQQFETNDQDEEPSPELLRVLDSYKKLKTFEEQNRGAISTPQSDAKKVTGRSIAEEKPAIKKTANELGRKDGDEKRKANIEIQKVNQKAEESDENDDNADTTSNRRTFQLLMPAVELGIKMIDADLGLGLTDASAPDTSEQDRARARARAQQMAVREAQEKLELERLKTQTQLQQMKTESEMMSKNTQIELDTIKTKLNQVSEQNAKERREKEELQIKLEYEAKLRERDSQELKRKLESEAQLREIERMKFQTQMTQEQAKRDRERLELKSKMEMEAALQETKMKKSSQEIKSSSSSTYDSKTSSSSSYDTKITSQYGIHDYRAPVGAVVTVTKQVPTVGFV